MRFKIVLILLLSIVLCGVAAATELDDDLPNNYEPLLLPLHPEDPRAVILKKEADRSLALARNAIKSKGFYCASIEVNIWKNLSERAGSFDEEIYAELKNQLYGNSMGHMDKWFNYYVKKGYYNDAQKCLQTWRLHALAIDQFDVELYALKTADLEAIKEK